MTLALADLPRFPCANNKRPLTPHGFYDARRDGDHSRWPLVGVPTGAASGIDVLDIDPEGARWLEENEARLPRTRRHTTQRGGRHLLFRHADGLRNSESRFAPGVDVRAEGGFVIWWPRQGFAVEDAPIAEWPEWLLKLALVKPVRGLNKSEGPPTSLPSHAKVVLGEPTASSVGYRLTAIMRKVENAKKGNRNATLYWAARLMSEMVARGEVKIGIARRLLESACRGNGLWRDPDDGPDRCRATIASAFWATETAVLEGGQEGRGPDGGPSDLITITSNRGVEPPCAAEGELTDA